MSRARVRRHAVRWARYVNRYAFDLDRALGGTSLRRVLWRGLYGQDRSGYAHVRRQAKRKWGQAA